ncbi:MAG: hypothetical protein UHK44_03190, partial [Bacteroidaceae bacterium]|nr:hypothetical protein [Bacteroidaceae bacterium]
RGRLILPPPTALRGVREYYGLLAGYLSLAFSKAAMYFMQMKELVLVSDCALKMFVMSNSFFLNASFVV